jgi:hypothetical protein
VGPDEFMMFEFRAQSLEISSSNKGLYFTCISHISPNIVQSSLNLLLERADEWQMRILSAKSGCIRQAVSGKLRVTLTQ